MDYWLIASIVFIGFLGIMIIYGFIEFVKEYGFWFVVRLMLLLCTVITLYYLAMQKVAEVWKC